MTQKSVSLETNKEICFTKYFVTYQAAVWFVWSNLVIRDHPYITSAKELGKLVSKMTIFADVQNCIYADIVDGPGKSKIMLT